MSVDEFDDFCNLSGVLNDLMTAPIISHLFYQSLLTSEDEIPAGSGHCNASLLEFMEMIARIAHEGSYPPTGDEAVDGAEEGAEMTVE